MCPHCEFDILYYQEGILIRKCRSCGELEIKTEYWAKIEDIRKAIREANSKEE
jgi:hypothetical protein